jgi:hypothetical protein
MQGTCNKTIRKNAKINLRAMGPDDKRNHPESSYSPLKYELGSNMEKTIDKETFR